MSYGLKPLIFLQQHTGWATDLKTCDQSMIKKRVDRTGDGTHRSASIKSKEDENNNTSTHGDDHDHSGIWGWG